jgi:hypothetical protein
MSSSPQNLANMATSSDPAQRLLALRRMREQIHTGTSPTDFLSLARPLVADSDNDCRWQALIVVGESVEVAPEIVWDVICEFGGSADEDMRAGVATVLLEHLLEHHLDTYLPKLRQRIESGNALLADTLRQCSAFGQAVPRWKEVEELSHRNQK